MSPLTRLTALDLFPFSTARSKIAAKIIPLIKRSGIKAGSVKLIPEQTLKLDLPIGVSCVRLAFSFATSNPEASCSLSVKVLKLKDAGYKIYTATSALTELEAAPWGAVALTESDAPKLDKLPGSVDVLVVGGG